MRDIAEDERGGERDGRPQHVGLAAARLHVRGCRSLPLSRTARVAALGSCCLDAANGVAASVVTRY